MKNDVAVLPKMGMDISSIKTTLAMTSFNVEVLDFILFAGLLFALYLKNEALYLKNEENKKMSDELARLYKKKR